MKLYCREMQILAVHTDDQNIPNSAYGDDVEIVQVETFSEIPDGYWSWFTGVGGSPPTGS